MIITSATSNSAAAAAYAKTQSSLEMGLPADDADGVVSGASGAQKFGDVLATAIEGAVSSNKEAEMKAASGLTGHGNLTDIVTSVSQAQMVLQTASVVRDKVIQSYQDIMRMTI
ncbi:flagellar hook-basal body complex protein FliE [Acetobacter sp.]|jgi:flagellar hook-basal body complex protein FliE|uniref:flagellar hook-basal body complex protein FliE n=1 Tax=Acetobacter sp. TaxID=440 RepID=UPI0025C62AB8|nr:flagellar hook-basal body complex protein FliE [Acetobacter sp.]MCH4091235.1 flagellar hook-basal body complex protein FliE [Acetobacter sp.]MCI1300870.1 flagellar hook-basal body complex protein FliE [Acetobacter sp.]MCI1317198.1 flagellar hook-basal body complex protein FliE [Acetobacter sp.]